MQDVTKGMTHPSSVLDIGYSEGLEEIETSTFWNTPWLDEYEGDFVQINDILIKYKGQEKVVAIPENIVSTSSKVFYDSEGNAKSVIVIGVKEELKGDFPEKEDKLC